MIRFLAAVFATFIAIALFPETAPRPRTEQPAETLYASHHCEHGYSWQQIDSDADSVTIRCYSDPDPDQKTDPE